MLSVDVFSVLVDDQENAHKFYTQVLGFETVSDIDVGGARWLTVASPAQENGPQISLEPDWNDQIQIDGEPAAKVYKRTLYEAGIPYTSFGSDDIHADCERMSNMGVEFKMEPTEMGDVTIAVFDDTCGNLIQLHQVG